MDAKEFLLQLQRINTIIENKKIEREQWENIALSIASGGDTVKINGVLHNVEKVQATKNPQKMADAINRYVDIESEITHCIFEYIAARNKILEVIEQLKTPEYDFLHMVYVQNLTLSQAAGSMRKSYSWATTMHTRALKSVQKILDERNE